MRRSISVVSNARLQSTRVPQKLMRPFAGTTLIEIALAKLNEMDFFEHRYLASAEDELIALGEKFPNIEILRRDSAAVQKGVNPQEVTFAHYLKVPSDYIFVFNPCLPCIRVETIKKAFDYFQETDFSSYTAVVPTGDWVFDAEGNALTNADPRNVTTNKNRSFFKACHAFHIVNKAFFRDNKFYWPFQKDDPHLIQVPEDETVDVDTPIEFQLAELSYQKMKESER